MSDIVTHVDLGDFETFRELRPDKAQAVKVAEETCEVYSAWEDFDRICEQMDEHVAESYGGALVDRARSTLLDECADVCQAVANLLTALGVDGDEWAAAIGRCEKRNRERGRY